MSMSRPVGKRTAAGIASAAVALSVLLVVAPHHASAGRDGAAPCGTRTRSCALPYPSMDWLRVDRSTPTGFHAQMAQGLIPDDLVAQLGPGAHMTDVLSDADGFSPLTPVIFELPAPVDPASVPADGGDIVKVFDLSTGARVSIRAEISKFATEDFKQSTVLLAWPVTRYDFATRYFAAVTDSLHGVDGKPLAADRGSGATALGGRGKRHRLSVWTRLQAATVDPTGDFNHYVSTTSFVTRSKPNVTDDVDRMAAQVRSDDHPIKDIQVTAPWLGGAVNVTGKVLVTDFRDADGIIPNDGTATGHPTWIDFTMVVPDHGATPAGAPLVIYGHGLSVFKETELVVATDNARHGIATIGVDVPDHGSRVLDGGFLFDLANPRDLGRLLSMPLQGVLDELSLLLSIKTHFATLDVLPLRWWANSWGDGVPELDTSHVLYEGTSMGGVLGLTFMGLAPEIEGGFLQVPGAGILDVIFHSILWQLFKGVAPNGSSVGDAHALLGGAHMLVDRADGTYYLDRIAAHHTPLYVAYAANDGVVPNADTDRIIALTGLPLVGSQTAASRPGTITRRVDSMPASGSGAQQIPTDYLDGNGLKPLLTHLAFTQPEALTALNDWLTQRMAAIGGK